MFSSISSAFRSISPELHINYRDQVDFLRRLIRCGGEVKTGVDGGITVTLSRLNTPAENQIATAFLNEISNIAPGVAEDQSDPHPVPPESLTVLLFIWCFQGKCTEVRNS